ncbi:YlaI family protein [Sporosarcina sp.]|uniref:YlaI family protein n=1 Tax=Sporosarcina sp. TaxID=49982 RepID=UPI0026314358|nr:YlaI family protein [Sporosarcina sp.]
MRVKCVLCDQINQLEDSDPLAKKLRNKPIHTYMCPSCRERISEKTEARIATGNFIFYRSSHLTEKDF